MNKHVMRLPQGRLAKKQQGFGLLEIMAVIVIVAVIAIGVMNFIDGSQGRARVSEAMQQTQGIQSAVRDWAPRSGIYTGVTIADLIEGGYFFPPRDPSTGSFYAATEMNPWGGGITVTQGPNPTTYVVTFTGITRSNEAEQLARRFAQFGTDVTAAPTDTVSVTIGDVPGS